MKFLLLTTALAVGAFAGYGQFVAAGNRPMHPDPLVTGSISPSRAGASGSREAGGLVLSNPVRRNSCVIRRLHGRNGEVVAERRCESVWPGLAGVVTLTHAGRGTMAMKDGRGHTILLLAAGDGVAYEAVEPSNALISVSQSR